MAVTDTHRAAGRRGPGVRLRLQQAAAELVAERGFTRTTATDIADRAGVTERTFFRHFPDKREVLLGGGAQLADALGGVVAAAPADQAPLVVLLGAFTSLEPPPDAAREAMAVLDRVVAETPALRELELAKFEALAQALGEALARRGEEPERALLTARIGVCALRTATARWQAGSVWGMQAEIERAFAEVTTLASPPAGVPE